MNSQRFRFGTATPATSPAAHIRAMARGAAAVCQRREKTTAIPPVL
jgi:hypothetical protein